jgi:DNA-directed RNA polymerase subunit RPC12/RpoP
MISNTKEGKPIAETEAISKVRCEYCGTLFNEVLDVCPHCGVKR